MRTPESQFNKIETGSLEQKEPEYLSQAGYENLKKELDELKNIRRKEIADKLEYALSLGDLTENTEYQSAKEEQLMIEQRIMELEDILSRAKIIQKEKSSDIQLGSVFSIKKEKSDSVENYSLVGPEEVDSMHGKISHESPLGKNLLGKKKGDIVSVITPNGKINYTVIDVD